MYRPFIVTHIQHRHGGILSHFITNGDIDRIKSSFWLCDSRRSLCGLMVASILFVSGSPSRQRSRSAALLDHIASRITDADAAIVRCSVRDVPADDLVGARRESDGAVRFGALVARSDAIVIATPVHNASMAGGLKALLDLLPERALQDKLVLPLASGGSAGHQLAIEYSMKPVLSALGARHVLAGVFACDVDVAWRDGVDPGPSLGAALIDRLDDAADTLVALLGAVPASGTRPRSDAPALHTLFAGERCSA